MFCFRPIDRGIVRWANTIDRHDLPTGSHPFGVHVPAYARLCKGCNPGKRNGAANFRRVPEIAWVEPVLRPVDKNAVEAALKLKEQWGGRVILLASARGEEKLRDGLATGGDHAVLLGPGSLTGPVLAEAIRKLGRFDLVLAGREGAGDRLAGVIMKARRGGWLEEVRGRLPLVLEVQREMNKPRHTSFTGILAAAAKTVEQWDIAPDGHSSEAKVAVGRTRPEPRRRGEMVTGEPEAVRRLVEIIREALGCTRPAVDEGWAPVQAMIGTSGATAHPDLYLGTGLAGDHHHLVGVRSAGLIIAVNNDPAASIFQQADYGVTADCRGILPRLVAALGGSPVIRPEV